MFETLVGVTRKSVCMSPQKWQRYRSEGVCDTPAGVWGTLNGLALGVSQERLCGSGGGSSVCDTGVSGVGWDQEKPVRVCDKKMVWV